MAFFFCYARFRYEVPEFQQRVLRAFDQLKDSSYWTEINADKPFEELQSELMTHCNNAIDNISNDKLDKLWWLFAASIESARRQTTTSSFTISIQ